MTLLLFIMKLGHSHASVMQNIHRSSRWREVTTAAAIDFLLHQGPETQSQLQVYNCALSHYLNTYIHPVGLLSALCL